MFTQSRASVVSFSAVLLLIVASAQLIGCAQTGAAQTASPSAAPARPAESPKTVLWVGNSFFYYNNSMHGHVQRMLADAKVTGTRATSVTISGAGIDWHDMASHFKPESGMAKYSFNSRNEVTFNKVERRYDAVIMMDCSQCPIHPTLKPVFHETVKKHVATVRANSAAPYLFASWAYADQPEMTEQLAAEYIAAAKQNNASVIPAGYAFANSIKARPEINLYEADKRHPSLAGTYLGAATVLAAVYKVNPTTVSYTAGLPADVAAHLRQVAQQTVEGFKP
jgi:hypothetical protein